MDISLILYNIIMYMQYLCSNMQVFAYYTKWRNVKNLWYILHTPGMIIGRLVTTSKTNPGQRSVIISQIIRLRKTEIPCQIHPGILGKLRKTEYLGWWYTRPVVLNRLHFPQLICRTEFFWWNKTNRPGQNLGTVATEINK